MSVSEQRVSANGVDQVTIEGTEGDLRIAWVERDDILVRGDDVEVEVHGNRVEIDWQALAAAKAITSILGIGRGTPVAVELPLTIRETHATLRTGDLMLTGPRGSVGARIDRGDVIVEGGTGEIEVKTGSGATRVDGFTGPIMISSGTGDVKLTSVDGKLTVHAGAGDVLIQGGAGPVSLKLGAGDAVVDERTCDRLSIKLGTGDAIVRGGTSAATSIQNGLGDIVCRTGLGIGEHDFTTGSGDVTVAVPRDLTARIEVTTARGGVDSELPLVSVGKRGPKSVLGRRLVGSVGDGDERAEIRIRSLRGEVDLRWLTPSPRPAAAARPTPPPPPAPPTAPDLPTPPGDAIPMGAPPGANEGPIESEYEIEQRVILSELAAGTLTIAEAARLLDALAQRHQVQSTTV